MGVGSSKAFLLSVKKYTHIGYGWFEMVKFNRPSVGSLKSEIPVSEGDTEVLYTRKGDLVREKSSDSKIS